MGFFALLKVGVCLIREGDGFDDWHIEYMERDGLLAALSYGLILI